MVAGSNKRIIIYDANSIIYYCFLHEERIKGRTVTIRVMEFTNKIQNLTEEFLKAGFTIETLSGVMKEIYDKGIAKIVDEFCEDFRTKDLIGLPGRRIPDGIKLRLARKTEDKIKRLQNRPWFTVVDYTPPEKEIERVRSFYESLSGTPKMIEHMRRKRTREPYPSEVDMSLLVYSKEREAPIVTNDSDLTDFKYELEREGLCYGIILDP